MMETIDKIIAYEQGELSTADTIVLFSEMIKNGSVWSLQGRYGRSAKALIDAKYISREGVINWKLINKIEL